MPKGWDKFSRKGAEALSKIKQAAGIPQGQEVAPEEDKGGAVLIPVDRIAPNPVQPRWRFDEVSLKALAESIRAKGMLQPVVVRRATSLKSDYELQAGERRLRAARLAGLTEVPAVIRETTGEDALTVALAENLQREDLTIQEKTRALGKLMQELEDVAAVASEAGKSPRIIERYLRVYSVVYGSGVLTYAFEREAKMDFKTAEALARLWEGLQGEARSKFVERANALGIRAAIRDFMGLAGGRPIAGEKDIYNIAVRKDLLVFTVRHRVDKELSQEDRRAIQKGLNKYLEKLTGQTVGGDDEGRK